MLNRKNDLLGREVYYLIKEFQKAGYYQVNFNGQNLPGGVTITKLKPVTLSRYGR